MQGAQQRQARSRPPRADICSTLQQPRHQLEESTTALQHGFLPWRSKNLSDHLPKVTWNRYKNELCALTRSHTQHTHLLKFSHTATLHTPDTHTHTHTHTHRHTYSIHTPTPPYTHKLLLHILIVILCTSQGKIASWP